METNQCSLSQISNRPPIQYAVVLDAGSTGSRVHVYRFNYCKGDQPDLEDEVFVQKKPGLSSYTNGQEASASLDELMQVALKNVPKKLHKCTPLTLKATAGLRMLPDGRGDMILKSVRSHLSIKYPFPIYEKDGIAIMGGDEEGVYAWITVNYLLGRITGYRRLPTAGVLDLGGGSTQIVFEPTSELKDGKHVYELDFNGFKYRLYQHSYDGYGLMQGRFKIAKASEETKKAPCVPDSKQVEITQHGETYEIEGTGKGFQTCSSFVNKHLFEQKTCAMEPCAFEGIYMPPIKDSDVLYAFSYFYDNFAKLFGKHDQFTLQDMSAGANSACQPEMDPKFTKPQIQEYNKNTWCMDISFMHSLLSTGYNLSPSRVLHTAKKINNIEIGWSLGLAIQMLDDRMRDPSNQKCQ
ncbi:nucleoside phosphatase GDA1/CD39 [Gorgonomyces haynaldii]|nr:nucleoside phosphatase GDA1/CD39 [Gorgonomyces haynaldii]